ncbi:MAG: ATP-binding protein, partial [Limisphaerales bacterium]
GQAALWVRGWNGWLLLPPLILATISAAWILGRAMDDADPITKRWGLVIAGWALFIGLAFSSSFPTPLHHLKLWAVAIGMLVIAFLAIKRSGHVVRVAESPEEVEEPATNAQGLLQVIQSPPFQVTPSFATARQQLQSWQNGSTIQLQIIGPAGVGKTAMIGAICREAKAAGEVAILHGSCPEPQDGVAPEPYRVIADALADHFAVNLLRPPESQLAGIDHAVDGIFEEVVPFSDILFPKSKGEGSSGSKAELFHSVSATLRCLAQHRKVVMIVDDAHWLDAGSRELLKHLAAEHPVGTNLPIALITASRKDDDILLGESIQLAAPNESEIEKLLVEGVGLAPKAANELAQAVGEEQGNLHWLFHMLAYLNGKGVLKSGAEGWSWDASTKLSDHLPDDLRESVMNTLNRDAEFRNILECAACIGPKFTVDVLSGAVGLPRFECIRVLDRLETETGYVRDLPEEDDVFVFRSSFLLEVIRNLLGIHASGPNHPSRQRVREHHSELAGVWESSMEQSSAATYRLANHRYAAGRRHADRAAIELLNAAWAASRQFQHEQARSYVAMAQECASAAGTDNAELARELLLIECHEAHVEGTKRVETAARIRESLESNPDSDFEFHAAAVLAAYDAGIDTRNQEHFAAAAEIGRQIIERFKEPLEQAHGHHFIGIALPVNERDERRKHMERAMELVDALEGDDGQRLKARIANSLGEQLSYGDEAERKRAREYFEQSIELKSIPAIRDVEGLALAHGGLGRLAYFAEPPDYETAREHFAEDLRYSEKIGSVTGQTKMHSLLGACDLNSDPAKLEDALAHYQSAIGFAEEDFDKYFALAGLIEAHSAVKQTAEADRRGQELVDLTKSRHASCPESDRPEKPGEVIPRFCIDALKRALEQSPESKAANWHSWLRDQLAD